jgi:hypothetical protein
MGILDLASRKFWNIWNEEYKAAYVFIATILIGIWGCGMGCGMWNFFGL